MVDNVIQFKNHVECLDQHLLEITLNSYRGTLPEIILCFQSKGAKGNDVRPTFISEK